MVGGSSSKISVGKFYLLKKPLQVSACGGFGFLNGFLPGVGQLGFRQTLHGLWPQTVPNGGALTKEIIRQYTGVLVMMLAPGLGGDGPGQETN